MNAVQLALIGFMLLSSAVMALGALKAGRWFERLYYKRHPGRRGERIGPFEAVTIPALVIIGLQCVAYIVIIVIYLGTH